MTALAPTLQAFFTDRLALQRQASGHTIAAYRDALKMLIVFAAQQAGKSPSRLDIADLDAQAVGAFLNHLENDRGNSVRTRNARLAAIHSLFSYAALRHPEHAADIQRVLAIPPKRYDKALITYLTEDEITALLAAPDLATWTGRRDRALLMLACQTGLRATELTSLAIGDVHLGTGAHVSCLGKGRKQRVTPLTPATVTVLEAGSMSAAGCPPTRCSSPAAAPRSAATPWNGASPSTPRSPRRHAPRCSRRRYRPTSCATPHGLLNAGVNTAVIALWMGHENTATTQVYIHADLALKERAIARTAPRTLRQDATCRQTRIRE